MMIFKKLFFRGGRDSNRLCNPKYVFYKWPSVCNEELANYDGVDILLKWEQEHPDEVLTQDITDKLLESSGKYELLSYIREINSRKWPL